MYSILSVLKKRKRNPKTDGKVIELWMGYMYDLALGLFEAGSLILYLLLKARIKKKITPEIYRQNIKFWAS
jgi:hypothetical protein